jgi:hypothetical protein
VEVRGDLYRVLIDGRVVVGYVRIPGFRTYSQIGLWTSHYQLKVKSFTVSSLTRESISSSLDTTKIARRALTWGDAGKPILSPHFLSPQEYAVTHGVRLAIVRRNGQIVTYTAAWGTPAVTPDDASHAQGVVQVDNAVTTYRRLPGAEWGYKEELRVAGRASTLSSEVSSLKVPTVGDADTAFSYRDQLADVHESVVVDVLDFRQASLVVHLKVIALERLARPVEQLRELIRLAELISQRVNSDSTKYRRRNRTEPPWERWRLQNEEDGAVANHTHSQAAVARGPSFASGQSGCASK